MQPVAPTVYRSRRPHDSPLYKLLRDRFDALAVVHEEQFQQQYGRLRHAAMTAPALVTVRLPDVTFSCGAPVARSS
jgi:hypothetical protein